jgi:UDP-glucose 4-epimerase
MVGNWLITGGCGYIGTSLIQHLRTEYPQSKIRVLDNCSVGTKKDLSEVCVPVDVEVTNVTSSISSHVEFVRGDIRDLETTRPTPAAYTT